MNFGFHCAKWPLIVILVWWDCYQMAVWLWPNHDPIEWSLICQGLRGLRDAPVSLCHPPPCTHDNLPLLTLTSMFTFNFPNFFLAVYIIDAFCGGWDLSLTSPWQLQLGQFSWTFHSSSHSIIPSLYLHTSKQSTCPLTLLWIQLPPLISVWVEHIYCYPLTTLMRSTLTFQFKFVFKVYY